MYIISLLFLWDISITSPVEGTVWEPGKQILISWTTVPGLGPDPEKIDIALMVGPAIAMNVVTIVKSGVDTKSGSLSWRVPNELTPGNQYAIRAGENSNVKYSHYFDVKSSASTNSGKATRTKSSPNKSDGKGSPSTASSATAQASSSEGLPNVALQQPTKVGGSTSVVASVKPNSVAPREIIYPTYIMGILLFTTLLHFQ
ncbi:hypothetical protein K493DRAFT_300353 [Basidiobolus meristosporus CBS 931.73]|uniref:Yeast cell wall synthesis Kre9/Knh1-like N-terminal domain-containing protein n=1 Tax=Basidiobolus meristosporus CBS 931.73 TaxID=1314790 RepID=A0A1Y1YHY8_9FUNG|nr:hypothetical protein K493DRAFT_300353 [Basidiobolus meristosporus CBS 931.73]|eukprot:ORX97632.1 hypothetical protein K493DRAFT_300353 [Basidiobolus meristosporus CBS 931.73]